MLKDVSTLLLPLYRFPQYRLLFKLVHQFILWFENTNGVPIVSKCCVFTDWAIIIIEAELRTSDNIKQIMFRILLCIDAVGQERIGA